MGAVLGLQALRLLLGGLEEPRVAPQASAPGHSRGPMPFRPPPRQCQPGSSAARDGRTAAKPGALPLLTAAQEAALQGCHGRGRGPYPGKLLAHVLPLLAVAPAQLLLVADEQAQLLQGPGHQGFGVALQDLAQRLRLGHQRPPALQGGGESKGAGPSQSQAQACLARSVAAAAGTEEQRQWAGRGWGCLPPAFGNAVPWEQGKQVAGRSLGRGQAPSRGEPSEESGLGGQVSWQGQSPKARPRWLTLYPGGCGTEKGRVHTLKQWSSSFPRPPRQHIKYETGDSSVNPTSQGLICPLPALLCPAHCKHYLFSYLREQKSWHEAWHE